MIVPFGWLFGRSDKVEPHAAVKARVEEIDREAEQVSADSKEAASELRAYLEQREADGAPNVVALNGTDHRK